MEYEEIRSEDRARKRRKSSVRVEARSKALVGRYVRKEFAGDGVFLGKVVSYTDGLFRVDYEDGVLEDLDCSEVSEIIVKESAFDEELSSRKKKLDKLLSKGDSKSLSRRLTRQAVAKELDRTESSSVSMLNPGFERGSRKGLELDRIHGDVDSYSDSCEFAQAQDSCAESEVPLISPPSLPPSSGNIGVPEESVPPLFSVYNFLRSFSIQLFLSPFHLDDFVGSLNCATPNTLMDGIHFSLIRALKRHLEMLSSDGDALASKCMRRLDWSLLDTLTWPVYLVEYLLIMGYTKGPDWKGFYTDVLDGEYYSLPVTRKLVILQILCDDVIESAELRAEIEMRESLEEGPGSGGTEILPPANGPRRVHPRYTKTSACKDPGTMEVIAEPHQSKPTHCTSLGSKVTELGTDASGVNQDGNSDECRLCGMDGTLLCCDGCPSVYHSRCIGLIKVLIPEGSWFCPECKVNKMDPALRIGTGLRGAEIFGIDPYKWVFLGINNHLIVVKASISAGPSSRYYNQNDVPKVLQVLSSSVHHATLYSSICKGILQYWEISEDTIVSLHERTETGMNPAANENEDAMVSIPMHTISAEETNRLLDAVEVGKHAGSVTDWNVEKGVLPCRVNVCQEDGFNSTFLDKVNQACLPGLQRVEGATAQKVHPLMNAKPCEQFGTESMMSTWSTNYHPDHSDLAQQSLAERYTTLDACALGNICGADRKGTDGMTLLTKNCSLGSSCESREGIQSGGGTNKGDTNNDCLYMGTHFKPQAYINQYILGDIAASAAANLAVLAPEENRVSEVHASSNPRKIVSAKSALQLKAFSSACICFFWPNSENKLMEVPRERCGWCLSCKAPITSKKGCLLNLAASKAIKRSARILVGLRPLKNGEGNLPGIATYILYMEESLRGLVAGPFLSASYRKQWRKQVENASTCTTIKFLLLELEEHIRLVAFFGSWVKPVDDWSVESSAVQSGVGSVGLASKRPGGKRNKKQSAIPEAATNPCKDDLRKVNLWCGGKLSKLVFQKGILPCSIVKKAARQGGSRKIFGIDYAERSEIPKRSRRFAWRAAVEMSRNAPHLALQVRYLDLHVRWRDLVPPEQNFHDGKGLETETNAFENAPICDKKIQENKIRYRLDFGNRMLLPSRLMKNIEVDQNDNGKDAFWFSETQIPLYLIKQYEEKVVEQAPLQPSKASHVLSKLQRRQLKASRRDIFSYLMHKGAKIDKCSCASCQEDVLLRDAVKCNECEGYCHKYCTIPATVDMKSEVDFVVTCNQCLHAKDASLNGNINTLPVTRGLEYQVAVVATNDAQKNTHCQPLLSNGYMDTHSVMKSLIPDPKSATKGKRGSVASYGLIWKKRNSEETGSNFRLSNILLRGNADVDSSKRPTCILCRRPYSSNLMYICCEHCKNWYHADAVQLKESQIFDVVGFRCCKCRRKASPICPYMDSECRKRHSRTSKQCSIGVDPGSETICEQPKEWGTTNPVLHTNINMDKVIIEEDDPLLFSLARVEPITEVTSDLGPEWDTFQGPQKLPVRRHVKHEKDANFSSVNTLPIPEEVSHQVGWELPVGGLNDKTFDSEGVNHDDIECEPQTDLSFTKLMRTDDNQLELFDASMDQLGNLGNSSACGEIHPHNLPEQYEMGTPIDHQEFSITVKPAVSKLPCQMCLNTEPAPDLSCEICGMCIHKYCSPWVEPTWKDMWRCGTCRDWR